MEALIGILIGSLIGSLITIIIFRIERKDRLKQTSQERKDKYRLAAVEKRLEAHQQAFKIWFDLLKIIHKDDDNKQKQEALQKAYAFWESNALYLAKRTRESFRRGIDIVSFHRTSLQTAREEIDVKQKQKDKELYHVNWDYFMEINKIIQEEVELEPLKPKIDITPEGELT